MGEIADMMLDGTLCQMCGEYLGSGDGYPVTCAGCNGREPLPHKQRIGVPKVSCPHCRRRVKHNGLKDHMRDAHNVETLKLAR